jgi:SPP1 family predicted phage head-tail adaptor
MITFKFNKRITILKEVQTRAQTGTIKTETKELCKVWAEVRQLKGDEKVSHGEIIETDIISAVVRYRKTIDNKCQIEHDGNRYNIVSVQELGRRLGLKLLARKIND